MPKGKEIRSKETKQFSESDLDMTWLLEVSENEFRMIVVTINTLKALMKKVDKMQGQIISAEMETVRKIQMARSQKQQQMKNVFDGSSELKYLYLLD